MNKDRALDELYKLARNCAEFNHKGCDCQCDQCGYNVFLYTNERNATLIKSNAYADYLRYEKLNQEIKAQETGRALAPLILIGTIVGLIAWACHGCGM